MIKHTLRDLIHKDLPHKYSQYFSWKKIVFISNNNWNLRLFSSSTKKHFLKIYEEPTWPTCGPHQQFASVGNFGIKRPSRQVEQYAPRPRALNRCTARTFVWLGLWLWLWLRRGVWNKEMPWPGQESWPNYTGPHGVCVISGLAPTRFPG